MSEADFSTFLADSFAILRRELPEVHERLRRLLQGRRVAIRVGAGEILVCFGRAVDVLRVTAAAAAAPMRVETSRSAILDLIDARTTLMEAVNADWLRLFGAPEDLLAFLDGLSVYVHGAVRAPSFPGLLRRYRCGGDGEASPPSAPPGVNPRGAAMLDNV